VRATPFAVSTTLTGLCLISCQTTEPLMTGCFHPSDVGLQSLADGHCDEAEASCVRALEHGLHDTKTLGCLGLVALSCHDDPVRAEHYLRRSLALDDEVAATHNNLGVVLLRRRPPQLAQACALFERATELDPDDVIAHDHAITCLAALTGELARGGDEAGAARAERRREAAVEARRTLELTRSATTRAPARRAPARGDHAR
jgi:Tfp pilus assembly protein PilF